MQFSTLNAYPSAVPVAKEIFADVLHAVPWAGGFQGFTTYRRGLSRFKGVEAASF
jgi:hypothetical protein